MLSNALRGDSPGVAPKRHEIADLERKKEDRANADRDEEPDPQIEHGLLMVRPPCVLPFHATPLNMNTVRTKSSARIASELSTTVRVVALETPSAVGFAS